MTPSSPELLTVAPNHWLDFSSMGPPVSLLFPVVSKGITSHLQININWILSSSDSCCFLLPRATINAWMFKLYILGASWVNFNSLKSLSGARMTNSKSETSAGWLLAHLKGRAVWQRKTAPGLSTPHLRCSVSASGAPTRTLQQQQTDTRTLFCLRSLDFTVRELF